MAYTNIEWLFEEMDGDKIVDVQHPESYKQALKWAEGIDDFRIGLVRDNTKGRSWAYVEDGKLPDRFADAYGEDTALVPAKYHREVS